MADQTTETAQVKPVCNCSQNWRYLKGHGPDPAHCSVHGDVAMPPGQRSGGDPT